ncbi:conserved hypothetical protein [Gammaproteobacteria bacterium]
MSDIETLIPPSETLTIGGENVVVSPLKVGQLPAFLRAVQPIISHLSEPSIDWLTMFGERGDDLLTAVAIAVKKPRTWVADLDAHDAILLAAKVIEINSNFFTRTVLPKLNEAVAGIGVRAGSTPVSG